MKNQDTWKFAHEDCGKRWWIIGWVMLLPTILVQLPFYGKSDDAIGWGGLAICVIECSVLVCSIIPTEKDLLKGSMKSIAQKGTPPADYKNFYNECVKIVYK